MPELDSLRFMAFLSVFLGHAFPGSWLSRTSGFGVDLFFALSAYLITELLLRERESYGQVQVKAFLIRRILRIWPLYFGMLGLAFVLRKPLQLPLAQLGIFAVFLGNFAQVLLQSAIGSPVIGGLWTVSIEEQFYLSWPFVMRRLSRRDIVWFAVCLFLLCALSRALVLLCVSGRAGGLLIVQGTFCRIDAIAVGLAISAWGFRLRHQWTLPYAAAVVFAGWWMYGLGPGLGSILGAVFAPSIVGIACGGLLLSAMNTPWMRWTPLCYLGRISYGLYVFHGPCLLIAKLIHAPVVPIVGLLLTLGVAALSYQYFERPFLSLKQRFEMLPSRPI